MYYFVIILVIVILFGIFVLLKFSKNKKLDNNAKKEIKKNLVYIKNLSSNKEKIVDYDKLYHKILIKLWFKGSFGEILKSEPKVINDLNKIWELHKLRNKLVHDFDLLTENILKKKAEEYERIINNLLKKV